MSMFAGVAKSFQTTPSHPDALSQQIGYRFQPLLTVLPVPFVRPKDVLGTQTVRSQAACRLVTEVDRV